MASGTIITQTRTSNASLPVENATVAYFEPGQMGNMRLLALRKSDSSGKTPPFVLETPDSAASQQPNDGNSPVPFRLVNIIAEHPDYERVSVDNVQVFAGVVTLQNLNLVPLPAQMMGVSPEEIIDTPAQNL